MILDTDSLTFLDNSQIYATPVDGGGNVGYTPVVDSPAPTLPDSLSAEPATSTTKPFTAPKIYRFAAPTGQATDVGTPSSGLTSTLFGTAPVATVSAPTQPAATTPTGGTTTGTAPLTSGPTAPIGSSGDSLINSLLDLMAAQYTGAHVAGGGTGFGGLVSGPLAGSDYVSGDTAAAPQSSGKGKWILLLLVAGITYWFYRSHKKHKAA